MIDETPRLKYNQPKPIIVGKTKDGAFVLKYGYGAMGVGSLWVTATHYIKSTQAFKDAPVIDKTY